MDRNFDKSESRAITWQEASPSPASDSPSRFSEISTFLRELVFNPREIGAAFPSSPQLANCLASFVPTLKDGIVLELGPGTGVVTAALLQQSISPDHVVAVERSSQLAGILKSRFPQIHTICGDAADLSSLLNNYWNGSPPPVQAVVSSLPLRSLPKNTVVSIIDQLHQLLGKSGRFIQFTYDLRSQYFEPLASFKRASSKIVWLNFPPARVDVYYRRIR